MSGSQCEYTSCDCDDPTACNYANGQGKSGTCTYAVAGLGCGGNCTVNGPYFHLAVASSTEQPSKIDVTVTHTGSEEAIDYTGLNFQMRLEGGEWKDIDWINPPSGQHAEVVQTWDGSFDLTNQMIRCDFNVELRESTLEQCIRSSYGSGGPGGQGTLLPVSLAEEGCNDPAACNFVSKCANDPEACVYANEFWTVDDLGHHTEYQVTCEGESV